MLCYLIKNMLSLLFNIISVNWCNLVIYCCVTVRTFQYAPTIYNFIKEIKTTTVKKTVAVTIKI